MESVVMSIGGAKVTASVVSEEDFSQPPDHEILDSPEAQERWHRIYKTCVVMMNLDPAEVYYEATRRILGDENCGGNF